MYSQIEFYQKYNLATTRQNIKNFDKYFEIRESLYYLLGIPPLFIKDRKVLEVGPGSGFNSLYTASLEPSKYVLVEPNSSAVEDIYNLFSKYPKLKEKIRVEQVLLSDFNSSELFDFVFCEGMLNGVPDPIGTLRDLASYVKPGGLLVITCVDNISYFPEILRRVFAQLLIDPNASLHSNVEKLLPVFSPHLSQLEGMTRSHNDWIIDNLLNPAPIQIIFSIPDAINAISEEFIVYGQSPHFVTDWRWYKTLTDEKRLFNQRAIEGYWQYAHNLMVHSRLFPPRDVADNYRLYELCAEVKEGLKKYEKERNKKVLTEIHEKIEQVIIEVNKFSSELSEELREAHDVIKKEPVDANTFAHIRFGRLWGRGQQYLSFIRKGR